MTEEVLDLIVTKRTERGDTVVLDLVAPEGAALPVYQAGAHVDVHIGPDLVRQYSLCGDPSDRSRYRLGVLLDAKSRGGSAGIHRDFNVGAHIRIGLPRNHFPLHEKAGYSVLVGGGIGITPVLAMAYALTLEGQPFEIHYCARTRDRGALLEEMDQAPFRDRVHFHFSAETGSGRMTPDQLPTPTTETHLYVCGPSEFMDSVIAGATKRGYSPAHIHTESFGGEIDSSGDEFEVVLAQAGQTVRVPSGVTIVKALAAKGIKIDVSCENGVCGTCLCNVLEGIPDHRDSYLTDEEKAANDQMTACCSRAKTPQLVLDL